MMLRRHRAVTSVTVTAFTLICFVIWSGTQQHVVRADEFTIGPKGQYCIGIHAESYFTDRTGLTCLCTLCGPGEQLFQFCDCNATTSDPQPSKCRPLPEGQILGAKHHKCSRGYLCKECKNLLTVKSKCKPNGTSRGSGDTQCRCVEGYNQLDGDVCIRKKRCDSSYELKLEHADDGSPEYKCVLCRDGYYQPSDNTTDRCRPHRSCVVRNGTKFSDIFCLNDPPQPVPTDNEQPLDLDSPDEGNHSTTMTTKDKTETIQIDQTTSNPLTAESQTTATENTSSQVSSFPSSADHDDNNSIYKILFFCAVVLFILIICARKRLREAFHEELIALWNLFRFRRCLCILGSKSEQQPTGELTVTIDHNGIGEQTGLTSSSEGSDGNDGMVNAEGNHGNDGMVNADNATARKKNKRARKRGGQSNR